MSVVIRLSEGTSNQVSAASISSIIIDMRCLQAPDGNRVAARARYLVTLLRHVAAEAHASRLIGVTNTDLAALPADLATCADEIATTAYIPTPGRNSLFLCLDPLMPDPLFIARLLLRPEIFKVAMLTDLNPFDDASAPPASAPPATASARIAQAEHRLWLKHYDMLVPYQAPQAHPEVMARAIWQAILGQVRRAALPQFAIGGRKPRLALISPMPPQKTGIADYSAALADALKPRAEVSVFTPENTGGAAPDAAALPHISRKFDRVINVIGNSILYHKAIFQLAMRFGGACICHDTRLLGLYAEYYGMDRAAAIAGAETNRAVQKDELSAWMLDETARQANFLDELATTARPLILHSRGTVETLHARGFAAVRHLPFASYRGWQFGALSAAQKQAARTRLGFARSDSVIVSFGFISPAKGIDAALAAMRDLRALGTPALLIWAGEAQTELAPWRAKAEALGVAGRVIFLDRFLDETTYRDYLLAADGALQLRAAGQGNISGALQDCIAAGLPAVANADLAENIQAPSYVRRVADWLDPMEIALALKAMLTDGGSTEIERSGYTARHSMAAYAEGLCKILELG